MTISDRSKLDALNAAFKEMFSDIYTKGAPEADSVYYRAEPCDGTSLQVPWLSAWPAMREWVGNKDYDPTRAHLSNIAITPKHKSTAFSLVDVRGDRSGLIGRQLKSWLANTAKDKGLLAFNKLIEGFSKTSEDGVNFFSTAHPNGSGGATQSNTTTNALTVDNFNTARSGMRALLDENGESLGINPTILMVGPKLEAVAKQIIESELRTVAVDNAGLESGTRVGVAASSNVYSTMGMRVVVNPRLVGTYDDYWFLIDDSKDGAPIIIAEQGEPEPHDNISTGQYIEAAEARFSVHYFAGVGFGDWKLIYGANVA